VLSLPRAALAGSTLAALLGLSGCFLSFLSPLPDMTTAADRARAIEPKCKSMSEDKVASFASPASVDSVEPGYSFVPSTASNHEARLRGALIHLRPTTLSREAIARGFECHQARVVLGRTPPFANDPYVLPGEWLNITVDSEGDGFAVQVQADSFKAAQRVLDRAKLFVASRPPEDVTTPTAPPSAAPSERPTTASSPSPVPSDPPPPPSDPTSSSQESAVRHRWPFRNALPHAAGSLGIATRAGRVLSRAEELPTHSRPLARDESGAPRSA
jgi:hypothetical protein